MSAVRKLLIVFIAIALLATACGADSDGSAEQPDQSGGESEASEPDGSEPIDLSWWWWGTGDVPQMSAWVDWVVDAYEDENPNISINTEERTDSDIFTAFEAAAAAGEGPDIAPQWASIFVMAQVWEGNVAPVSDYVDESEMDAWLNTAENDFEGKTWAAPIYIVGLPLALNRSLFEEAGIDPEGSFDTWESFIGLCGAFNDAGITPIVGGNRGGFEASWWHAHLAKQYMDSPADLQAAVLSGDFSKISPWLDRFKEMLDADCFNEDLNSLELQEKYDVFNTGGAAMTLGTDGAVLESAEALGAENLGVTVLPAVGSGVMADFYTSTQSISHFITSWSPEKQAAADFMTFWHSEESLAKWFELTGTMPADSRFDVSQVTDPTKSQLFALNQLPSVWLSNFEPPQLYEQADLAGGQILTTGSGSASDVVDVWVQAAETWKQQKPEEVENFRAWAGLEE